MEPMMMRLWGAVADFNNMDATINVSPIPTLRIHKDHPKDQILGDPKSTVQTRRKIQKDSLAQQASACKTGFRNAEGIDYDEVFAPVARIEAIRLFLAFASYMGFTVYQMDVKSAFLYGYYRRGGCMSITIGFVDPAHPKQSLSIRWKGLQVKQQPDGIFISQDKYVANILKKFDFWSIKIATTPIESNKPLVKDKDGEDVDLHVYRSMTGSLMYLTASRPDIMFAVSANCCGQVLGIQNQMIDYGFNFMNTRIHIDNESTISVIKNPVAHSRTKHIEIQFHFIRDCYEKRLIEVIKIHTDFNVTDLLTKGFDVTRFNFLVTDGNAEFHEIIDFLTRSSIHYALTVSPVVSTTFVEQFWMIVKSKTINNVRYITATVVGKPVSISEASIRSDLQFNDVAGIDVLPNQAIFDTIQLMGLKSTSWDQIPTNIATADAKKKFVMYPRFIPVFLANQLKNVPVPLDHFPINALTTKVFSFMVKKCKKNSRNVTPLFPSMLAQPTEDEGAVLERPSETQPTPSPTHPSEDKSEPQLDPFLRPSSSNPIPDSIPEGSGGNHGGQSSSDRSLSRNEDGLTLQSVYDLYVSLCKQVTTQAAQIKDLKAQIKQLKKKAKPIISHHNAWIKSVSIKKRLVRKKSLKTKLMQKESVSKQGRKPAKSEPTLHKDLAFDDLDDAMDYMETEDAYDEGIVKDSKETRVSIEFQVSTDKPNEGTAEDQVSIDKLKVSTDKPSEGTAEPNKGTAELKDGNPDESVAPTTVFRDDETIAQFLVTLSQNKTKQKGFEIKEIKDTDRPRTITERSMLNLKPLPKIDPKDKGKKVLEEKAKSDAESEGVNEAERKFAQLANDEEIARKVQEEWEAEEEKKKLAEEEATKTAFTNEYEFIQARLNADKILAEKLQEGEREKFTIEQRAKFLHDTIAAQRRFLAKQRSEAIRNKLPIRNQLRNQMMTYLKANENFIPFGSDKDENLIEKMNRKAAGMDKEEVSEELESTKVKAKIKEPKENIRKRLGRRLKMKAPKRSKRQKTDSDHEKENQLRTFLKIVYDYGHFERELIYYIVFRADGSSRWIKTFSEMIKLFDRIDLVEIHSLVMKRVHVLRLEDGTEINMLAERRYPLTKNTLERMMDLRLTAVSDDDTVFDLLRFIEQQIDEFGSQDGKGKLKENQGHRVDTDQVHQNGDLKNRSVWIHPPGLQDVYTKET
ncbi:putative ribonuclease H-like domain-containing protein [Tanacetum coccineum]|uniref:Ribonuclease H-like domain-containing protein n=1 Tax=Tanacetum coccineum TaxID=301880 RepID=A0ABQ4WT21_9ASTR